VYVVLEGTVRLSGETKSKDIGVFGLFGETEIMFGLPQRKQSACSLTTTKCMKIR
jgi:hypothetical protein